MKPVNSRQTPCEREPRPAPRFRPGPWARLLFCLFILWGFAFVVGPWLEKRIPVFNEIVDVIEENDIDSGAYFYTEIKASYDGERYLRESVRLSSPEEATLNLPFVSGIVICILILWIGWKIMPFD